VGRPPRRKAAIRRAALGVGGLAERDETHPRPWGEREAPPGHDELRFAGAERSLDQRLRVEAGEGRLPDRPRRRAQVAAPARAIPSGWIFLSGRGVHATLLIE